MQLSHQKQQIIRQELNTDESLVWSGEPNPSEYFKKGIPMMFLGIPFTGFAIFWMYAASGFKVPDFSGGGFSFFPLFGIPFFLVGLGILLSPFWQYKKAKKGIYVITSKRAIIFEGFFNLTIRSFKKYQLEDIERIMKSNGFGSLIFSKELSNMRFNNQQQIKKVGFWGIKEPKKIESLLQKIQD